MLYYLSSTRFPSPKAHAIQQVRMCQAFEQAGESVSLVCPRSGRAGTDWDALAEYYGLSTRFDIIPLPTWKHDVSIPLPYVPNVDFQVATLWLMANDILHELGPQDIIYARTPYPIWFYLLVCERFDRSDRPSIWFEQHQVDRGVPPSFYESVDGVVCISDHQASRLTRHLNGQINRLRVEHDGVDLSAYQSVSTQDARRRIGIDQRDPLVVYTGHLYPSKDVESLVQAMAELEARCLIVGGDPSDIRRINESMTIPSNVTFTGMVPPGEVPSYQIAADVLVATFSKSSELEYFSPLKLFEYMASGTPMVVARKPAFEEVLQHGESALFVEPESPNELRETISTVLDNPALGGQLGTRARQEAAVHAWSERADRILTAIRSPETTEIPSTVTVPRRTTDQEYA